MDVIAYDIGPGGKIIAGVLGLGVLWFVLGGASGAKKKKEMCLPGSTRFKAEEKEVSPAAARATGAVMCAAAVALMFAVQWAARTHPEILSAAPGNDMALREMWMLRLGALLMPVLAGVGLARMAAGKSPELNKTLGVPAGIAGLVVGALFTAGMSGWMPNIVHDSMAGLMDSVLDHAGAAAKPGVTRADLDAALAEVSKTAADLAKRQQSVNMGDKAAVAALQKDIDAYNARQAAVRKMYDDYTAGPEATAALRKQIVGKWKEVTPGTGATMTRTFTFAEDGGLKLNLFKDYGKVTAADIAAMNPGKVTSSNMDLAGTWTLQGKTLAIHCPTQTHTDFGDVRDETVTVGKMESNSMSVTTEKGVKVWQRVK